MDVLHALIQCSAGVALNREINEHNRCVGQSWVHLPNLEVTACTVQA